ncbi:RNA methyltransferase [Salinimonas sp. HHU 13199]|uniref:RNA methyltransferase n=1 Tax=Salinimonas profundi TaxID=2729140 RepID=A0ABR8LGU1_9ALTE|nr:RNA methyltransferase [Salinimonas profundi]MBD3584753.1 RNA methyltransferase [Salinimonas profundi]
MKLDDVKKLHQKKYRSQFGYYLIEGEHLLLELDKAGIDDALRARVTVYVTADSEKCIHQLQHQYVVKTINQRQMAQLSGTKTPQGIIATVPLPEAHLESLTQTERCIYLHEVQDPGNLGTILRSLAWFGQCRLLLSPGSVDPYNAKVVRASMGAIFHVPIEMDVTLASLSTRFGTFAYLDMQGTSISDITFKDFDCYLFGNEARGVPFDALQKCDAQAFTISGSGHIDSLNLASAVTLSVYQLSL